MSIYAIGDLQGCYLTLQALLDQIKFDASSDRLCLSVISSIAAQARLNVCVS